MENAKIMALACQEDPDLPIINLTCKDKFKEISWVQHTTVSVMAKCPDPEECGEEAIEVEGAARGYSPESKVCQAAAHAGKLVKTGAGFVLTLSQATSKGTNFKGTENAGIKSSPKK